MHSGASWVANAVQWASTTTRAVVQKNGAPTAARAAPPISPLTWAVVSPDPSSSSSNSSSSSTCGWVGGKMGLGQRERPAASATARPHHEKKSRCRSRPPHSSSPLTIQCHLFILLHQRLRGGGGVAVDAALARAGGEPRRARRARGDRGGGARGGANDALAADAKGDGHCGVVEGARGGTGEASRVRPTFSVEREWSASSFASPFFSFEGNPLAPCALTKRPVASGACRRTLPPSTPRFELCVILSAGEGGERSKHNKDTRRLFIFLPPSSDLAPARAGPG